MRLPNLRKIQAGPVMRFQMLFPEPVAPVRKEDATSIGNMRPGQRDVFQDLRAPTGAEGLVQVGAAERAAVVGTAVGHLQDVAVRLARRPDDRAVVSHGPIIPERTTTDNSPYPLMPVRSPASGRAMLRS